MKKKLTGLFIMSFLLGPASAWAISGTWYFAAPTPGMTYTGQFSFTDLDIDRPEAYENSQEAGFTFSSNFPTDSIGGVAFNYGTGSRLLEIGGLDNGINGVGVGDFILSLFWPDPIEFPNFFYVISENEEVDVFDVIVSSSPIDPSPVPEPGSLALLSLGLAGLGLSRRRRSS